MERKDRENAQSLITDLQKRLALLVSHLMFNNTCILLTLQYILLNYFIMILDNFHWIMDMIHKKTLIRWWLCP